MTCIKPDMRGAADQRVIDKAGVEARIGHDQGGVGLDGVAAEGLRTGDIGRVQPVA